MSNYICSRTQVRVEDLHLEAYVGLYAPERDQLQTIAIDIVCELENPEVLDEDLANSVDYVPLVEEVKGLTKSQRRHLIETLAEEIAQVCLRKERTKTVLVSIRKPHKLPGVKAVGITRLFERG
ncbi:MAG TPA: dihydroneopterin aldolase [Candidatus Paceibacterota bacterium]